MTQAESKAGIKIEGLDKFWKENFWSKSSHSLKDLTLLFPINETTALMGHNGAGKTTTIKIILGLIFPNSGNVFLNGQMIKNSDRKYFGYMPESTCIFKSLTCREVLRYHLKAYSFAGNLNKKVDTTLDSVGLEGAKDKQTKQLSKGMARRLAWALATIHDPEYLILDEPYSGMDPLGRIHMRQWLSDLKNKNKTIILCSHEIEECIRFSHNFHILKNGQLAFSSLAETNPEKSKSIPSLSDHSLANFVPCKAFLDLFDGGIN